MYPSTCLDHRLWESSLTTPLSYAHIQTIRKILSVPPSKYIQNATTSSHQSYNQSAVPATTILTMRALMGLSTPMFAVPSLSHSSPTEDFSLQSKNQIQVASASPTGFGLLLPLQPSWLLLRPVRPAGYLFHQTTRYPPLLGRLTHFLRDNAMANVIFSVSLLPGYPVAKCSTLLKQG